MALQYVTGSLSAVRHAPQLASQQRVARGWRCSCCSCACRNASLPLRRQGCGGWRRRTRRWVGFACAPASFNPADAHCIVLFRVLLRPAVQILANRLFKFAVAIKVTMFAAHHAVNLLLIGVHLICFFALCTFSKLTFCPQCSMFNLQLCQKKPTQYDMSAPSSIKIALPGVTSSDADRRR